MIPAFSRALRFAPAANGDAGGLHGSGYGARKTLWTRDRVYDTLIRN